MTKWVFRTAVVIVAIIVVMAARWLFFHTGFYAPAPSDMPRYEHIRVPPAPSTEFFSGVSDNITRTVLIDLAHDNNFKIEELNVLILRLISRGLTINFLNAKDDLKENLLSETKGAPLPGAFIIVTPQKEFSTEEGKTVREFVDKGGKLLLIGDPTRASKINSIAIRFGLIFEPDYLYNMRENEMNYQNIFVTEFKENEITKNLRKVVLYVAGSISSALDGIAFVDQNTFSSLIESRKRLSPMALAQKSKVLAVHDLTFMAEPYNSALDNNQLIVNIANWLASPPEEKK